MAIGGAGIKPSQAFGADQFDKREDPNNAAVLQRFFNWYYAFFGFSDLFAFTVIVYIQQNYGWKVGFGVPVIVMTLSIILFFLGSPWYVKLEAEQSLFTGLTQVVVAAFKNRHLDLSPRSSDVIVEYYKSDDSKLVAPTDKLRYCLHINFVNIWVWC